MRKKAFLVLVFILTTAVFCFAQGGSLLLDDFEGVISGGPEGTVDFGAGGGSKVEVTAATDVVHSGKQSLKLVFDSAEGGYMWIARGFGLDAKNAGWLVNSKDIEWSQYKAIAFYVFGSDSKAQVAFDIKDNGNEMWRFMFEDNFNGWKQIVCPFSDFFARGDWQPDNADKNAILDFPVNVFQFEPRTQGKGVFYFDDVELIKK